MLRLVTHLLDDIKAHSNAAVTHLSQVLHEGVGNASRDNAQKGVQKRSRVSDASEGHRDGNQKGDDRITGRQTEVLLRDAVEEEDASEDEDDQQRKDDLLEGFLC